MPWDTPTLPLPFADPPKQQGWGAASSCGGGGGHTGGTPILLPPQTGRDLHPVPGGGVCVHENPRANPPLRASVPTPGASVPQFPHVWVNGAGGGRYAGKGDPGKNPAVARGLTAPGTPGLLEGAPLRTPPTPHDPNPEAQAAAIAPAGASCKRGPLPGAAGKGGGGGGGRRDSLFTPKEGKKIKK